MRVLLGFFTLAAAVTVASSQATSWEMVSTVFDNGTPVSGSAVVSSALNIKLDITPRTSNGGTSFANGQEITVQLDFAPTDGGASYTRDQLLSNVKATTSIVLPGESDDFTVPQTVTVTLKNPTPNVPVTSPITITIHPGAAVEVNIGDLADVVAGQTSSASIQARDEFDNLVSSGPNSFGGSVTFTFSGSATGTTNVAMSNGVGALQVTDNVAQVVTVTATSVTGGITINGGSQTVTFSPGPTASLGFSGLTTTLEEGGSTSLTITAKDAFGNTVLTESRTIELVLVGDGDDTPTGAGVLSFTNGVTSATIGDPNPEVVSVSLAAPDGEDWGSVTFATASITFTAVCDGTTQYQDVPGQTFCKDVRDVCEPGFKQTAASTPTSDRVCTACGTNEYQDEADQTTCKPVSAQCTIGQYESLTNNATQDRECTPCNGVDEYQDVSNQKSCKTATVCVAGQYMTADATASSNRVCESCPAGTADLDSDPTTVCDTCNTNISASASLTNGAGATVTVSFFQPTPTSPVEVKATIAGLNSEAGLWKINANPAVADHSCSYTEPQFVSLTTTVGTLSGVDATTFDTSSSQLSLIGSTSIVGRSVVVFKSDGSSWFCGTIQLDSTDTFQDSTGATVCLPVSQCTVGQEELQFNTASQDRTCRTCPSGEFQDEDDQRFCKKVHACAVGERTLTAPNTTFNRVCTPVVCEPITNLTFGFVEGCDSPSFGDVCNFTCDASKGFELEDAVTRNTLASPFQLTCNQDGDNGVFAAQPVCGCIGQLVFDEANGECTAACPTEQYSLGGKCTQCTAPCDVGTEFEASTCSQVNNTNRVCATCKTCPSGFYATGGCTGSQDTICEAWTVCEDYQYETSAGNSTHDRECTNCTACPSDQFAATGCCDTTDTVCQNLTVCEANEFESSAPSDALQGGFGSDRACTNRSTECSEDEFLVSASTTTSDLVCSLCTICTNNTYPSTNCSETADTVCSDYSTCVNGTEYEYRMPSPNNDRECRTCTPCSTEEYKIGGCDGVHDTVCALRTQCDPLLEWESDAGDAETDRTCEPCTDCATSGLNMTASCSANADTQCDAVPASDQVCERDEALVDESGQFACVQCYDCPIGKFAKGGPECPVFFQPQCTTWDICGSNEYSTDQAPDALHDRLCRKCTTCPPGQYKTGGCVNNKNTVCSAWKTCPAGTYQLRPGTPWSDRECAPCTVCGDGEYAATACSATSDTQCTKHTQCSSLEYISTQGTSKVDAECTACHFRAAGRVEDNECPVVEEGLCGEPTPAPTQKPPPVGDPSDSSSSSDGAIIGGAVAGGIVFLILLVLIIMLLIRRRGRRVAAPPKPRHEESTGYLDVTAAEEGKHQDYDDASGVMLTSVDAASAEDSPADAATSGLFESQIKEENRKLRQEMERMKAKLAQKNRSRLAPKGRTAEDVLDQAMAAKLAEENSQLEAEILTMKHMLKKKKAESRFHEVATQQVRLKAQKAALEEELAALDEITHVAATAVQQVKTRQTALENEELQRRQQQEDETRRAEEERRRQEEERQRQELERKRLERERLEREMKELQERLSSLN